MTWGLYTRLPQRRRDVCKQLDHSPERCSRYGVKGEGTAETGKMSRLGPRGPGRSRVCPRGQRGPALAHTGCYASVPQPAGSNDGQFSLSALEAGKSTMNRLRSWEEPGLRLADSRVLTGGTEGDRASSPVSLLLGALIRPESPTLLTPSKPSLLPELSSADSSTLGVRGSKYEFGGEGTRGEPQQSL